MTASNDPSTNLSTETTEQLAAEAEAAAAPAEAPAENADGKAADGKTADAKAAEAKKAPEPVKKSCSQGLTAWMRRNQVSIAFTSYQSGRLYLLGSDPTGRLSFHERIYQRAMGVVGNGHRLFMGGLYQIWRFENILNEGQQA